MISKNKLYRFFLPKAPLLAAMLVFAGMSCEDRYYPEIDQKYEQVLVVDGMISTLPGPYTVKLTYSTTLDRPQVVPVSGWNVSIAEASGTSEKLTETEPGVYVTSPEGIQGIAGKKYRLELTSGDGKQYFSEYEELLPAIPIDSLYAQVDYVQVEYYPYDLPGYRFYADVHGAESDTTRFMWRLEESFEYHADFMIFFTYDGVLHRVYNIDTLNTCYRTNNLPEFKLLNTQNFSTPDVDRFPLLFVGTDSRKLNNRYSLLATQYNLSQAAYTYWENIDNLNTETGDLYTSQPFQIRGNVSRADDPTVPVYGYFMAAGVSSKRIFVNRPKPPVQMYFSKCTLEDADYKNYGFMFYGPPPPPDDPNLITQNRSGVRAWTVPGCVDCRVNGGKLEKPDFWIDQ